MPSYGSSDMPVVLDPFRTIVEVHWPAGFDYLVLGFGFSCTDDQELYSDDSCMGGGEPFPTGGGPHWATSLISMAYTYKPPGLAYPPTTIQGGRYIEGEFVWGAFVNVAELGIEITARPSLPTETFDPWDKTGGFGGWGDGVNSWAISGPKGHLAIPGGSGFTPPIPIPGSDDEFFVAGTGTTVSVYGHEYDGEPFCIDGFGASKVAHCSGSPDEEPFSGYENAGQYGEFDFDASGITITVPSMADPPKPDRIFVAVGVALTGGDDFKGGKDMQGGVAILFIDQELLP